MMGLLSGGAGNSDEKSRATENKGGEWRGRGGSLPQGKT
jgi:hypothetical protein